MKTTEASAPPAMLDWAALKRAEPRLAALELEIRQQRAGKSLERVWYGRTGYKSAMSKLVGHLRTQPGPGFLFSCEAYDIAYFRLVKILETGEWPN